MIHDNVSTQKRMCVIKGLCAKHEFVESCKVWTLFLRSGQWRRHVSSVAKVSKCAPAMICGMGLGMKGCDVKLNVAQCLLWCGYQMLAIIYTRSTCPSHVTSTDFNPVTLQLECTELFSIFKEMKNQDSVKTKYKLFQLSTEAKQTLWTSETSSLPPHEENKYPVLKKTRKPV